MIRLRYFLAYSIVVITVAATFDRLLVRQGLAAEPKVPAGFSARLVATVPAVTFPCQIATAPDGSLFVAEDPMDQVGPYESDHGRILLLRDGKEPVVFADGLRAVFGMVWRDGALYVMHMPRLTVFRDTDGDGKADSRKELFKDLGPGPKALNDHIVSGLQFGMDGRLYISVGDKGVPDAHGPDGVNVQLVGGGILRCNPDGTKLEVVSSGTRNHLEPNLDDRDNLFTYDNTDDGLGWWTRVTHHVDGGYYGYPYDYHDFKYRILDRLAEYGGGSPCGGVVYKEDAWPTEYRNRVFWAEWGKRQVAAARFDPAGASFKVAEMKAFAEPAEGLEFRPIDLALSYDGKTLFVADWGMGGWGSKTEKVGRVFAITYTGPNAPKTQPRGNDSDPLAKQFAALDHASFNERTRAQLAIVKMGKNALRDAEAALVNPKTSPVAKRHLVWIVDDLAEGTLEGTIPLRNALESPIADVRAQAARALGLRAVPIVVDDLVKIASSDPEPSVRLQAVIALGRIGDAKAVATLGPILLDSDPTLAFSARQALRRINNWSAVARFVNSPDAKLRDAVLNVLELQYDKGAIALLKGEFADESRPASERAKAVRYLSYVHRKAPRWKGEWWGTRPASGAAPVKSIPWEATPSILTTIRSAISDSSPEVRLAAVVAVREMKDRNLFAAARDRFSTEDDSGVKVEIAKTLGALKDQASLPALVAVLRNTQAPGNVADAALDAVEQIGGRPAIQALTGLLTRGNLPDDRQRRAIAALGRFRAESALVPIRARLKSKSPEVQAAAVEAIGLIGKGEGVVAEIRGLISDKDLAVRKAAIGASAALKDREAVPLILAASDDEATRFESTKALAAMPDPRALPLYLRGLSDRNQDVRKACSAAMSAIRREAQPSLERLAARRELPSSALPELRRIFAANQPITTWHIMGPVAPNERPPVPPGKKVNPAGSMKDSKGNVLTWKEVKSNDPQGTINVGDLYPSSGDGRQAAFAFAEVDSPNARPARLSVGSDDTLEVWINGKSVYKFNDSRGHSPEQDTVDINLKKGENLVFLKCGNIGGGWEFSLGISNGGGDLAFLKGSAPGAFDPEAFRTFALGHKGKAERGKTLFADAKGIGCVKCHAVSGQGGAVGPDLTGIGARYPREDLVRSVLYPSEKIFSGYEPTVVATVDGKVVTGIVKSDNADELILEDAEAKRLVIKKGDIEARKKSDVSLMPNGLAEGLTRDDFADLIAYLETLKEAPAVKKP